MLPLLPQLPPRLWPRPKVGRAAESDSNQNSGSSGSSGNGGSSGSGGSSADRRSVVKAKYFDQLSSSKI